MPNKSLPEWEQVLSAAAHLQAILPGAVLVGGTAAAIYARHRLSSDADHIVLDLRGTFDQVLSDLECVAGWSTARVARPVLILGSLDGIETGVRQLIREQPLETTQIESAGHIITVPTLAEMLRIKAVLILKRNATRDYLDFVALSDQLGEEETLLALRSFDVLYPQSNGESALQQLQVQLASPLPYDLDEVDLREYSGLARRWQSWAAVQEACLTLATAIFERAL